MQATAKSSYMKLQQNIASQKRPKNTSGSNEEVPPHTARSRPAAKRTSANKRLFPMTLVFDNKQNFNNKINIPIISDLHASVSAITGYHKFFK